VVERSWSLLGGREWVDAFLDPTGPGWKGGLRLWLRLALWGYKMAFARGMCLVTRGVWLSRTDVGMSTRYPRRDVAEKENKRRSPDSLIKLMLSLAFEGYV